MTKYFKFHLNLLHHRMFNIKTIILLGVLWITEDMMLQQVVALGTATGEKITPAVYVFLQSCAGFLLIFLGETLVFYSDVPFFTNDQMYVILRTGKIRWYLDQIVYIAVSSLLILLTAFLFCLLRTFSILKFSLHWDRILGTLALTDAGRQFEVAIPVPYKILNYYKPVEAIAYSLLIGWGVVCFVGMLMFTVSLIRNRKAAIVIATVMILVFGVQNYYSVWVRYLIPLSWMQITELGVRYSDFAPTQRYVFVMLPLLLGAVFLFGLLYIKKTNFEWTEEE